MLAGLTLTYLGGFFLWLAAGYWALRRLLRARRRARLAGRPLHWIHLGLSTWLLLAGLTLIEGYFALIYDQSDSFNMTNVSRRWYARHVRFNPQGWRDVRPLEQVAPAGVRRLWFVGDSFTFAQGISNPTDRLSDRVSVALEAAHPGQFAVSTLAEPGLNIPQIEKVIRSHLEAGFQFDTLVYVICLNDIEPYVRRQGEREFETALQQIPPFIGQTYFFNLLWFRLRVAMRPGIRDYYADLAAAWSEGESFQRFVFKLDELRALCASRDADLRVVIFPFVHNLGAGYPFQAAHRSLVEFCQEHGIPVLDLEPELAAHASEGLMVNRFDAHPSVRAHQIAAEEIERHLLSDLLSHSSDEPTHVPDR